MPDPWHWNATLSVQPRGIGRPWTQASGEVGCSFSEVVGPGCGRAQGLCLQVEGAARTQRNCLWQRSDSLVHNQTSDLHSHCRGSKTPSSPLRSPAGTDIKQTNRKEGYTSYSHVNGSSHKKNEDSKKWQGLSTYILDWAKSSNCRKVTII